MGHLVTIFPAQAARICQETARTGAAIGVSQSGSVLTLHTSDGEVKINAGGADIPAPDEVQGESPC